MIALIVVCCFVGPGCRGDEWVHRGECFTVITALGKAFIVWACQLIGRETSCMTRGILLVG